jgi:PIN domain nuclease of toxin-antitoxin system
MRLLLDTHVLLWFQADDLQSTGLARSTVLEPTNERWLSPISLLEIALKNRLGKLPLSAPFGALYPSSLLADEHPSAAHGSTAYRTAHDPAPAS